MEATERRFTDVYARKRWASHGILSGFGSRPGGCAEVAAWIQREADNGMGSLCDLGCGDVEWISRIPAIRERRIRYYGIDAVSAMVEHHKRIYPWFRGEAADLEEVWETPARRADMVILKDVLFHLCNGAAETILMHLFRERTTWRRLLVSTHAGVDNKKRHGLRGPACVPLDVEAMCLKEGFAVPSAPVHRFVRPDGGEWIVWSRGD